MKVAAYDARIRSKRAVLRDLERMLRKGGHRALAEVNLILRGFDVLYVRPRRGARRATSQRMRAAIDRWTWDESDAA